MTKRLAFIATEGGSMEIGPAGPAHLDGWTAVVAGLKYELLRGDEQQFVMTPGSTFEAPTGNSEVFQGYGKGEANVFVLAMKGWDRLHLAGLVGVAIPMDWSLENASLCSSAQLHNVPSRWFIPFASVGAVTVVSSAIGLSFQSEGFDLINFGSLSASGRTQGSVGGGFRSGVLPCLDLGVGYDYGVFASSSIFKDPWTFDVSWRLEGEVVTLVPRWASGCLPIAALPVWRGRGQSV